MAKRKTPKTKNLRPEKITDAQLSKVQNVIKSINEGQMQLGMLETKKHALLHDIMQLQGMVNTIQQEFKKEYGDVDIDITNGKIEYNKNEQVNS